MLVFCPFKNQKNHVHHLTPEKLVITIDKLVKILFNYNLSIETPGGIAPQS